MGAVVKGSGPRVGVKGFGVRIQSFRSRGFLFHVWALVGRFSGLWYNMGVSVIRGPQDRVQQATIPSTETPEEGRALEA